MQEIYFVTSAQVGHKSCLRPLSKTNVSIAESYRIRMHVSPNLLRIKVSTEGHRITVLTIKQEMLKRKLHSPPKKFS